jgi:hypothetical protein
MLDHANVANQAIFEWSTSVFGTSWQMPSGLTQLGAKFYHSYYEEPLEFFIVCRARRARKTVDYAGNAYDNMIREAIRGQSSRHDPSASHRHLAAEDPRCRP